jgi:hypothetical protein
LSSPVVADYLVAGERLDIAGPTSVFDTWISFQLSRFRPG